MTSPAPPVLAVEDVSASARWWADLVGFAVGFVQHSPTEPAELNFAVVVRDDVEVHLARRVEISDRRRAEITVTVLDLPALAAELIARSAPVRELPSGSLVLRDPDGNRVVFSQAT